MAIGIGNGIGFNRVVSSAPANDPDVQAFLDVTGITDATIIAALNFRVKSLKGTDTSYNPSGLNVWAKMVADYPYVGGTATTHKYNLFNVANYIITWFGGVTHNSNGITGNGTNAYGSTGLFPSVLGQDTAGDSFYSRNAAAIDHRAVGVYQTSPTRHFYTYPRYSDNNAYYACNGNETSNANSDGSGNFIKTRIDSTHFNSFIRGTKTAKTQASSGVSSDRDIWVLSANGAGEYSTINLASYSAFNASLTDGEAAAMKAIDTQFQTILGRNV